jgi:hypothetical protein
MSKTIGGLALVLMLVLISVASVLIWQMVTYEFLRTPSNYVLVGVDVIVAIALACVSIGSIKGILKY